MRKQMPKLSRIGKRALGARSRHHSLWLIYGDAKVSFYRASTGTLMATGISPFKLETGSRFLIAKFDSRKRSFVPFVEAALIPLHKAIRIEDLTVLPRKIKEVLLGDAHDIILHAKQKTGLRTFRLVLNQAIAMAKEHGFKEIKLNAQNEELKEFYEMFGFKFKPKELEGTFKLK